MFYNAGHDIPYRVLICVLFDKGFSYVTFSKRMWEASDITLALNGSVGTEVSIDWIYKDDDPKSHYNYADMLIEKTDDHLYKVSFCGYGVKTRYFEQ